MQQSVKGQQEEPRKISWGTGERGADALEKKSPIYEWVPLWEDIPKSNLFVKSHKVSLVPTTTIGYIVL